MELGSTVVLLFITAGLVALAARRLRVPYTVALVVAGIALGAAHVVEPPVLTKDLLFALFLPGLLFEAAFQMEAEDFWRDRTTLFALALPGVAAATAATAALLVPALAWAGPLPGLDWRAPLVFATLIAATDPIAVVAVFRTLGAPRRLGVLVEGESLLNDGTAAVFFALAVALALGTAPTTASLAVDFVYAIGGAVIVGGAIGLATSQVITRLDDPMLEITLTTITAYGSFLVGERLHVSGVIATVTAGLLCGNRATRSGMRPSSRAAVTTFWEYVAFALNSLVFLLIGFQVRLPALLAAWRPILVAYAVVTVVRTLTSYAVAALCPAAERLPHRWTAVLAWSGMRGALALVLALSLPAALPHRAFLVTLTFGVVTLSILAQGLTIGLLTRWLGVVRPRRDRRDYERARADLMAARAAAEELELMSAVQVTHPDVYATLTREYGDRIARAEGRLRALQVDIAGASGEELNRARRHLLLVERDHVADAFRLGAMGEAVRDRLLADIDARWVRAEVDADAADAPHADRARALTGSR